MTHPTPSHKRRPGLLRTIAPAFGLALVALLLGTDAAHADLLTPESGGSPNADRIDTLYKLIGILAIIVFVGVEGTLIWCLVRYKAGKGRVAQQIHGNTKLEIGWTVGAAVILVFITIVTFIMLPGIKNPEDSDVDAQGNTIARTSVSGAGSLFASTDEELPDGKDFIRVHVNGQQYAWRYEYQNADGTPAMKTPSGTPVFTWEKMVVPAGRTVVLDISSDDVAHSWWIPKMGGKMDALPGYTNHTWFKAPKAGMEYRGQCAELCGRNHPNMTARVQVVTPQQYQQFLTQTATDLEAAASALETQRKQLKASQAR